MDACSGIAVYRHSSGKYSKPERKCSEITTKSSNEITTAEEFPTKIPARVETYTLTADIKLADGQQITNLAGTLDGQGHQCPFRESTDGKRIRYDPEPGELGSVDVTSGYRGSIADNLTGTIQNSYSQARSAQPNWNTVGGLAGTIKAELSVTVTMQQAEDDEWRNCSCSK